jgi:hypothetical protein
MSNAANKITAEMRSKYEDNLKEIGESIDHCVSQINRLSTLQVKVKELLREICNRAASDPQEAQSLFLSRVLGGGAGWLTNRAYRGIKGWYWVGGKQHEYGRSSRSRLMDQAHT